MYDYLTSGLDFAPLYRFDPGLQWYCWKLMRLFDFFGPFLYVGQASVAEMDRQKPESTAASEWHTKQAAIESTRANQ